MNKILKLTLPIVIIVILTGVVTYVSSQSNSNQQEDKMQTVISKDGTKITYDKTGKGKAVILVGGALVARSDHTELAQLLSSDFIVYNYDRRGRGDSGDTKPYTVEREIEDIEALVNEAGGSVYLYGISSGAALSLRATAVLGDKVKKLAIYEAPYSEMEGAAQTWKLFRSKLKEILAADQRSDAVELHLKNVGAPDGAIALMKISPKWPVMEELAPTLAYDAAIVGEDRSVPVEVAAQIKADALVMDGGASLETMPFMRPTAEKIATSIPSATHRTIEGQSHDLSSKVLAPILIEFFSSNK